MSESQGPVGAVLVAAGRSERMGQDKVWAELFGRPVLMWSVAAISASTVQQTALVVSAHQVDRARSLCNEIDGQIIVVPGGDRRRDSVLAGLEALPDVAWVAVHDAARPLLTPTLVNRGIACARRSGSAVPVVALPDTIKVVENGRVVETLERSRLRAIQTPQVFRRDLLAWALSCRGDDVTDEAGLLESLGAAVRTFDGDPDNFKLTYPGDLERAERLLRARSDKARL